MEAFVGEDFELAAVWNEESVEVLEDRGHVSMGAGEVMGPGAFGFTEVLLRAFDDEP